MVQELLSWIFLLPPSLCIFATSFSPQKAFFKVLLPFDSDENLGRLQASYLCCNSHAFSSRESWPISGSHPLTAAGGVSIPGQGVEEGAGGWRGEGGGLAKTTPIPLVYSSQGLCDPPGTDSDPLEDRETGFAFLSPEMSPDQVSQKLIPSTLP